MFSAKSFASSMVGQPSLSVSLTRLWMHQFSLAGEAGLGHVEPGGIVTADVEDAHDNATNNEPDDRLALQGPRIPGIPNRPATCARRGANQAPRRAAPFPDQWRKLFPFAVAQPHNICLCENFFVAMIASRRSARDESESSNPFKSVEAKH
jgi:hypothetical protein